MDESIDVALLAQVASIHMFHRKPTRGAEVKAVFDVCQEAMALWQMMQTLPESRIGSESRAKQILAEYLRQRYEQKTHDSRIRQKS